jgi:hypothetical protein
MNNIEIKILNENFVVDTFIVYQFLKRLVTPFRNWEAFKLGIIDENGLILKKRKELKTPQERNSFSLFDLMVLKMKRVLERLPFGKSRIASYAAALYFIKESKYYDENHYNFNEDILIEFLEDFIDELKSDPEEFRKFMESVPNIEIDEMPTNNIGSGNIAGVLDGSLVRKKPKILRRKDDENN